MRPRTMPEVTERALRRVVGNGEYTILGANVMQILAELDAERAACDLAETLHLEARAAQAILREERDALCRRVAALEAHVAWLTSIAPKCPKHGEPMDPTEGCDICWVPKRSAIGRHRRRTPDTPTTEEA